MGLYNRSNYFIVFRNSFFITAILWLFPFCSRQYADTSFPYIPLQDIPFELIHFQGNSETGTEDPLCPVLSPKLSGPDFSIYKWIGEKGSEALKKPKQFAADFNIKSGGVWHPEECQAQYESVIIVPYRNRYEQLQIFLQYMHPFLQRQHLHYRIVVVEQMDDRPFNRGRLLNIGFKEARNLGPPNICFIFHDVDLLPQNDYNIYACTHQPRHMYSSVDIFRYHLPYRSLAGGSFSILVEHFKEINGFSNSFDGWGGEDDDFSFRLHRKGLEFCRFDPQVANYVMLPHKKALPSPDRFGKLASKKEENPSKDGLSTLKYKLLKIEYQPLYTHLFVQ
ncbi:Beta-1,4-N-acetylgalactosaminyltransferase bre-4 [Armadillidium vulgare]|nr:Beta-1,4-N-acetylgalactosaminyltransferase bre-4 [Armadillidium vulgare]